MARLKRMAGFESQNFDPVVSHSTTPPHCAAVYITAAAVIDQFAIHSQREWALESLSCSQLAEHRDCWQENDVEREFQIHRTEADYSLAEFWKWTLALAIGVIMGVLGFVVDWGIEKLNNFKYANTVASIKSTGKFSSHDASLKPYSR